VAGCEVVVVVGIPAVRLVMMMMMMGMCQAVPRALLGGNLDGRRGGGHSRLAGRHGVGAVGMVAGVVGPRSVVNGDRPIVMSRDSRMRGKDKGCGRAGTERRLLPL